jgi:twitching motility protein PilT
MIDRLTTDRHRHVVTIEDPIEHVHAAGAGLVTQRELGRDTRSIQRAVRAALRQDADVVAIGELAEAESVEAALMAADAGALCLAAARGASVIQAIARLVDLFPPQRQPQVRAQLAHLLEGMVNQRLVPRAAGGGRVLAVEMLVPTPATRALIREDSLPSLYGHMQAGPAAAGLQTLNRCLADLYLARQITLESAVAHSADATELQQLIAAGGDAALAPARQGTITVAARRA